MTAYSARFRQF